MYTHISIVRLPLHPGRIARIHNPRFVPRVGLPRNLFLIGSLTAALRFSKGWVRRDANLGLRIGCTKIARLKISGKFPVDMRTPPLKIEIRLESNPPKSIVLV